MAKGTSGRESFGSFGRWLWTSSSVITFPARLAQTCCRCCRCSCCCCSWCWCCCCDCCCSCECHQIGPVVSKLSIFSHFCLSCMRLLQCCNGFSPVFMRVLSLKNSIQSHLMVLTHIYIYIYTHQCRCMRGCMPSALRSHVSLSLPLPYSAFGSLTFFWLRLPAEKGNCNYNEGVARRKQLKGRHAASSGHKLFVVLWLPSCLAGKYMACGWCASTIYVAPARSSSTWAHIVSNTIVLSFHLLQRRPSDQSERC